MMSTSLFDNFNKILVVWISLSCFSATAQNENKTFNRLEVGFSHSRTSYLSVGYQKGWYQIESRLFVDMERLEALPFGETVVSPDIGFTSTFNIFQESTFKVYAGLGAQYDLSTETAEVILPIGTVIYPFADDRFGFQIEYNPYLSATSFFHATGSLGIRYTLRSASKSKPVRAEDYSKTSRSWSITLGSTSIAPGFQYAWFRNNLDFHVAVGSFPTTLSTGVYYHFMQIPRKRRAHLYTGLDVGYMFNYTIPNVIAYVPIGVQFIYPKGFTLSLEVSAFYVEATVVPWVGIKLGKSIFK